MSHCYLVCMDAQLFLYSPSKVAEFLGVSRGTVYRLMYQGRLKAQKLGRRTVISHGDLEAYLSTLPPYVPGED